VEQPSMLEDYSELMRNLELWVFKKSRQEKGREPFGFWGPCQRA
jgi:hypothetical protein